MSAATSKKKGEPHVALFRGVNLGGHNRLPMKRLAEIFAEAGATDIVTFIQSGNVVFRAAKKEVVALVKSVEASIASEFGFEAPIVWFSRRDFDAALAATPFPDAPPDSKTHAIVFFPEGVDFTRLAAEDRTRFGTDRYELGRRVAYLHIPAGLAKTKLTNAFFDSRTRSVSTGRNLRTSHALAALLAGEPADA